MMIRKARRAAERTGESYKHYKDWTNRLILADLFLVMNSLLDREMMAGKVQCIYLDPPYGVKFSSNFHLSVKQRRS